MPISKDYQTVIYHTNMTNKEGKPTEQVRILMAPITEKKKLCLMTAKLLSYIEVIYLLI